MADLALSKCCNCRRLWQRGASAKVVAPLESGGLARPRSSPCCSNRCLTSWTPNSLPQICQGCALLISVAVQWMSIRQALESRLLQEMLTYFSANNSVQSTQQKALVCVQRWNLRTPSSQSQRPLNTRQPLCTLAYYPTAGVHVIIHNSNAAPQELTSASLIALLPPP